MTASNASYTSEQELVGDHIHLNTALKAKMNVSMGNTAKVKVSPLMCFRHYKRADIKRG